VAVVKRAVRVNLDGDIPREGVQLITTTRPNPFGGTAPLPVAYVRVVDRRHGQVIKHRVSPRAIEHACFRVRDLNRDGRLEVWFSGIAGNGFSASGCTSGVALPAGSSGAGTTVARAWGVAARGLE
jgi:hypothetical protein